MSNVRRIYVEKKEPYAVKAKELHDELKNYLGIDVAKVREFIRYDVENISDEVFARACKTVFSEPPVDDLYEETIEIPADAKVFSVEFLPGQFDQRADSAVQCVKFLKEDEEPVIRTAVTYMIEGQVSDEEFSKIKSYCINPVDSRETGMEKPDTLITVYDDPADVAVFDGFRDMDESSLKALYESLGLAMTFKDFLHIQKYFHDDEKRDPSMTEIRVLDTYWSDHCRHTTFSTELTDVEFGEGYYRSPLETTYQSYLDTREEIFKGREDKFVCLMDLAMIGARYLRKIGKLDDLEVFHPSRMASRILGMGDVLSLIEKAQDAADEKAAEETARRMMENKFDMNDMLAQFAQIRKMGGAGAMLSMMPGMSGIDASQIDEKAFDRIEAMIYSMTKEEREKPSIINPKRKRRIAAGSGTRVEDVNKLLKQFEMMQKMMKQFKKSPKGFARRLGGMMGNPNAFRGLK